MRGAAVLRRILRTIAIAFGCVTVMSPTVARSDQVHTDVEVVCHGDAALVRSITAWNDDSPEYRRIPETLDDGLSAVPPAHHTSCRMANGWDVRIRSGEGQAFAYGMGGADPPAFFSLWVAHRKVLSRKEWKPGYASEHPWLVAVVIKPTELSLCEVKDDMDAPAQGTVTCRTEPFQLKKYKIDQVEFAPPGTRPPVGTVVALRGSSDPVLCRRYLRAYPLEDWDTYSPHRDTLFAAYASKISNLSSTVVDLLGGRRRLILWSGDNHYFDGDLVFIAPPMANPSAVLKDSMLDVDEDHFQASQLPKDWSVISGGRPDLYPDISWRYVHFHPRMMNGHLYLLAQPTNWQKRPSAILVQPLANGYRSVCYLQRVEPNF